MIESAHAFLLAPMPSSSQAPQVDLSLNKCNKVGVTVISEIVSGSLPNTGSSPKCNSDRRLMTHEISTYICIHAEKCSSEIAIIAIANKMGVIGELQVNY